MSVEDAFGPWRNTDVEEKIVAGSITVEASTDRTAGGGGRRRRVFFRDSEILRVPITSSASNA